MFKGNHGATGRISNPMFTFSGRIRHMPGTTRNRAYGEISAPLANGRNPARAEYTEPLEGFSRDTLEKHACAGTGNGAANLLTATRAWRIIVADPGFWRPALDAVA